MPKDMSIPRAELLTTILNATTGQIALIWINSIRSELKFWARNRVIEINRVTDINSWRYVKSTNMIAELGTRKGALIEDKPNRGMIKWQTLDEVTRERVPSLYDERNYPMWDG